MNNRGLYRTSQDEEDKPVHDQDRPKDRDIEDIEPAADERNDDGASCLVPEFELGKATDKWPELLVLLGGETTGGSILHLIVKDIV